MGLYATPAKVMDEKAFQSFLSEIRCLLRVIKLCGTTDVQIPIFDYLRENLILLTKDTKNYTLAAQQLLYLMHHHFHLVRFIQESEKILVSLAKQWHLRPLRNDTTRESDDTLLNFIIDIEQFLEHYLKNNKNRMTSGDRSILEDIVYGDWYCSVVGKNKREAIVSGIHHLIPMIKENSLKNELVKTLKVLLLNKYPKEIALLKGDIPDAS